jgi:radical SAM-linked protein
MLTGVAADRELADLWLSRRLPVAEVRAAVTAALPPEIRLVEVHDVWAGAPALAASVISADYRVDVADGADPRKLADAAVAFLAATTVERERARGDGTVRYDLRPLVDHIAVEPGPPVRLRIRTRFHPERGTGRPQDVLAAVADLAGAPAEPVAIVRERLILDDPSPRRRPAGIAARRPRKELISPPPDPDIG